MTDANEKVDYLFKIVLIGDSAVGKTNILSRLVSGEAISHSKPTIGVEFGTKTFKFDDSVVKAQIWDTAGQERYHAITAAYYRGSYGAVIVYDITLQSSLRNAQAIWLKTLKSSTDPGISIVLLGNKKDMEDKRAIETKEGRDVAMKNNTGFFETSAISGENVAEAFEIFIRQIYEKEKNKEHSNARVKVRREDLVGKQLKMNIKKSKKSSCC